MVVTALAAPPVAWARQTRIAFRFCCIYIGLYVSLTFMLPGLLLPAMTDFELGAHPPVRNVVEWTATHVFHVTTPLVVTDSGSGDKTFDWVEVFCVLVTTTIATLIWSAADRQRAHYRAFHKWFHLFVRIVLGSAMLTYGLDKVTPLQMPYPGLARLVEPFGNFSSMGVLWASIGASRSYEIFIGAAEVLAGLLVMIPRTALLGALVCLVDTIEIFALNMTYDIPVKQFSFHLILFSLFLIAPDAKRLVDVFILNRHAEPSTAPALFSTPRRNRIALGAQLFVIVYVIGMNVYSTSQGWTSYGGGAPKSPLYGIWNVTTLTVDGVDRPPLVTDTTRWRRVLFDQAPNVAFQQMDDVIVRYYPAAVDESAHGIVLNKATDPSWHATFTYVRASQDRLTLDGAMDGRTIHAELDRFDLSSFLLLKSRFRWVQEYPFNR